VRPALTRAVRGLLAALTLLCLLLLPGVARAADADPSPDPSPDPVPRAPVGKPWFGPGLDWSEELPADYVGRLDRTPSIYAQRVDYPLTDQDATYLEQFAQQAATQGAVAVLSLEPQQPLGELTGAEADRLADELAELHRQYDTFFLVRFAPEMNGSWVTWGQQPEAYVAEFRRVARAVHAATDQAAMVWSPAYGAGYPFGKAYGNVDPDTARLTDQLDTDGDGTVDDADDPYGPYYPGAEAADWVGLSLYRFGSLDQTRIGEDDQGQQTGEQFDTNTTPTPGELEGRLDETLGYGRDVARTSFYERFAAPERTPFLVETGALYDPHVGGSSELDVKRAWWRQLFAAISDHPLIAGISWLELDRSEAEADDRTVEWGAARTGTLARALRRDLDRAPVTLGPVTRVLDLQTGNAATAQGRLPDADDQSAEMGWIVFCAALLAVGFLLAGLVGRWLPSWRYPKEDDPRDQRLDLFRGWIILTVVFTHIEVAGLYSYISLNAIGAITGAEMFVLLSGIVLGMVYLPGVARVGEWGMAVTMLRRARKQYLVTLAVVILVWLLGKVPHVSTGVVTTFTDRGTGENGEQAAGQVYDLYPNFARLFDYPPPWYAVKQLLLIEMGPWVFNIMGLFIVLSLALPALMWLIKRGLWWLLLAGSWVLFVINFHDPVHPLPSQFEYVFPLLSWQVLFTHGLVLGTYRRQVTRALTSRWGKLACGVFVVGYGAALVYLWAGHHFGFLSPPFPADSYGWLYAHGYNRVFLQPGRLVDCVLMVICAYAVLTTCWKPINAAVGWLWTPLGSASLYVFVVHVFFVIAVANIPHLDRSLFWVGTLIHTVVMLLIWVMVKKKVLFSVIPR
jgi:hypothetical protein